MTSYEVAVPSRGRPARIATCTLAALRDGGVPPERVRVFVAPDEVETYRAQLDGLGLCRGVVAGGDDLRAQRVAISEFYGDGARVVQIDDDMRAVVRRVNERRLAKVEGDLAIEFEQAFDLAAAAGCRLWGVYPTANAGWMKPRTRQGLSFICGGLFGHVVDTGMPHVLSQKEDFERTLRYWQADGAVLRVEWLSFRSTMYAPGGMQAPGQPDRREANEAAVTWLLQQWPAVVRVSPRTNKNIGRELRLHAR